MIKIILALLLLLFIIIYLVFFRKKTQASAFCNVSYDFQGIWISSFHFKTVQCTDAGCTWTCQPGTELLQPNLCRDSVLNPVNVSKNATGAFPILNGNKTNVFVNCSDTPLQCRYVALIDITVPVPVNSVLVIEGTAYDATYSCS